MPETPGLTLPGAGHAGDGNIEAGTVAGMARSYGRSALRCRAASYRNTPAATDTFRLLTVPTIGIAAR